MYAYKEPDIQIDGYVIFLCLSYEYRGMIGNRDNFS
jgi:hypothetical protein